MLRAGKPVYGVNTGMGALSGVRLSEAQQREHQRNLLLEQTPVIYAYFYNYLSAWSKSVTGPYPTAIGHIFLQKATKS